jgi:hypothetical protein
MSLDLDAVRQNVDRIAITQEQITCSVDRLTASQDQMMREMIKLQAVEQQIFARIRASAAAGASFGTQTHSAVIGGTDGALIGSSGSSTL